MYLVDNKVGGEEQAFEVDRKEGEGKLQEVTRKWGGASFQILKYL